MLHYLQRTFWEWKVIAFVPLFLFDCETCSAWQQQGWFLVQRSIREIQWGILVVFCDSDLKMFLRLCYSPFHMPFTPFVVSWYRLCAISLHGRITFRFRVYLIRGFITVKYTSCCDCLNDSFYWEECIKSTNNRQSWVCKFVKLSHDNRICCCLPYFFRSFTAFRAFEYATL